MSLSKRVKHILENQPHCRDSDVSLCTQVWCEECQLMGKVFTKLSAIEFIHYIHEGKLSKSQSILRRRREWNNKMPSLAGKSYHSRANNNSKYVKNRKLPNLLKRAKVID